MSALLNVTESILDSLDKGNRVGIVALDLKKAFDTVDHDLLLNKLKKKGINGNVLKWFEDYLVGRRQCTVVNGIKSSFQSITCGIPQGSNIGPLLFVLYVDDLTNVLNHCKVSLYADDTCIYVENKNVNALVNNLNDDLSAINKWLGKNKLALNVKKCEFLLVGSRNRIRKIDVPDVCIGINVIKRVTKIRYLGIVLDEYLDWSKQADKLKQDVGKSLYLLKRIRPFISQQTALVFYKSLIQSKFEYCDVIWGNLGKVLNDHLQRLQNRALRCVLDVDWMYPSELLCTKLDVKRLDAIKQLVKMTSAVNF